jgi:hypothetical protein
MVLAARGNYALAVSIALSLRDLDRVPSIMYSPTEAQYFYDLTCSLFRAAEIGRSYVQHLSRVHTLALVSAGMGWP